LKRKFRSALNRRNDARSVLAGLYDTRNPHVTPAANYTNDFFIREWTAQRKFQAGHTEAEQERRAKLVKLYKQEAALENLKYIGILFWNFKNPDGLKCLLFLLFLGSDC
jgi:hypothetical protein